MFLIPIHSMSLFTQPFKIEIWRCSWLVPPCLSVISHNILVTMPLKSSSNLFSHVHSHTHNPTSYPCPCSTGFQEPPGFWSFPSCNPFTCQPALKILNLKTLGWLFNCTAALLKDLCLLASGCHYDFSHMLPIYFLGFISCHLSLPLQVPGLYPHWTIGCFWETPPTPGPLTLSTHSLCLQHPHTFLYLLQLHSPFETWKSAVSTVTSSCMPYLELIALTAFCMSLCTSVMTMVCSCSVFHPSLWASWGLTIF